MPYITLFLALLIGTAACSAPNGGVATAAIKPHNAERELQTPDLQGGEIRLGARRFTVLTNMQISPAAKETQEGKTAQNANAPSIARIAGYTIARRVDAATPPDASGPYLGAVYQHDTQEVGLVSKEISIRFKGQDIAPAYRSWGLKELVPNSGLYILTVTDINSWMRIMQQLQSDPDVALAQARIMTRERRAR